MANEKKTLSKEEIEKMIKDFQNRWELGSVRNLVSNNMAVPDSDGKFTVNGSFNKFKNKVEKGEEHTEVISFFEKDGANVSGEEVVKLTAQKGGYYDMNPEQQPEEQQPDK